MSSADKDPDRTLNTDIFVVDAKPDATPRKLTNFAGPDRGRLGWSPDSNQIAYLQGSESKYSAYSMSRLAVVPAEGGASRILTEKLDRGVSQPVFSEDGRSVTVLVADDRLEYPAKVSLDTGEVDCGMKEKVAVTAISAGNGHTAVLASSDGAPPEIFAFENNRLRKLTAQNDALVSELALGPVEDISFHSADGTEVHGLVTRPADYKPGAKIPTLLRIHGGPNGQDAHSFNFERRIFAANGYAVVNINYRGSSGRGHKFGETISADWGDKEVADC